MCVCVVCVCVVCVCVCVCVCVAFQQFHGLRHEALRRLRWKVKGGPTTHDTHQKCTHTNTRTHTTHAMYTSACKQYIHIHTCPPPLAAHTHTYTHTHTSHEHDHTDTYARTFFLLQLLSALLQHRRDVQLSLNLSALVGHAAGLGPRLSCSTVTCTCMCCVCVCVL